MTNSAGDVIASYTYDSYGNLIASSGTTANTYGFTGEQQFGEADGLVFLRARYYDPRVGRFLQTDPIGYQAGLNLYMYVHNNPLNWTDSYGLSQLGVWAKDSGLIGVMGRPRALARHRRRPSELTCLEICELKYDYCVIRCDVEFYCDWNPFGWGFCKIKCIGGYYGCVGDCTGEDVRNP